jgi:hypothetical protein
MFEQNRTKGIRKAWQNNWTLYGLSVRLSKRVLGTKSTQCASFIRVNKEQYRIIKNFFITVS